MKGMKIALGADHAGFELKARIAEHLRTQGFQVMDAGTQSPESVDYPDFARTVADHVAEGRADRGVLVCGTGIGMAISANKVPSIRAANCHSVVEAKLSREHNNANILTLGARVLDTAQALAILDAWNVSEFAGGERHERRIEKIHEIEQHQKIPTSSQR